MRSANRIRELSLSLLYMLRWGEPRGHDHGLLVGPLDGLAGGRLLAEEAMNDKQLSQVLRKRLFRVRVVV
jgi:hypothetical protein